MTIAGDLTTLADQDINFLNNIMTISVAKKCSDRTVMCQGSQCKSDGSQILWRFGKTYHCPRELLWRKCCVNECKVTYFCTINQFQELFEANGVIYKYWLHHSPEYVQSWSYLTVELCIWIPFEEWMDSTFFGAVLSCRASEWIHPSEVSYHMCKWFSASELIWDKDWPEDLLHKL
jgi:hypothetical protein